MASKRAWRAFVVLAAVLMLVTAGCDSSSGNEAKPTNEPAKLFVPCDGISDDAIRAAGADPATEESGIAGVHQTDLEICTWSGPGYYLNVYSWPKSIGDLRNDDRYREFEDRTVAGRQAVQFREASDDLRDLCDVAVASAQGSISVNIDKFGSAPSPEDPCVIANRTAEVFAAQFPS